MKRKTLKMFWIWIQIVKDVIVAFVYIKYTLEVTGCFSRWKCFSYQRQNVLGQRIDFRFFAIAQNCACVFQLVFLMVIIFFKVCWTSLSIKSYSNMNNCRGRDEVETTWIGGSFSCNFYAGGGVKIKWHSATFIT